MPSYKFPRPALTVDLVLVSTEARPRVLLIRRKAPPCEGAWALPGGFVDQDEDLEPAARRELVEETAVQTGAMVQLGAYGKPGRDPRGHTVSVAFLALTDAAAAPVAGDDAREVRWCSFLRPPKLAFDHRQILKDARRRLSELATLDQIAPLLPARFSLPQLSAAYRTALGQEVSTASLKRRLLGRSISAVGGRARAATPSFRVRRGS